MSLHSRVLRLACVGLASLIALVSQATSGEPKRAESPRLPGHRTLFNGDCNFLFFDRYNPEPRAKFDKNLLHDYVDLLARSGVDTYVVNSNAQVPWYPSKRTPNIITGYRRGDREFVRRHFPPGFPEAQLEPLMAEHTRRLDRYLDLAEAGVDWLAEIASQCRRRRVSPWLSIRMNDLHGANDWDGSYMNCALQRDPRYRLSGRDVNRNAPVRPNEQGLNYAHREVRDYMLLMVRELVEDYDFEGLELDWLRCPFCCEPPATAENIQTMTGWIAEIRALTQDRARKTGRTYPLGLRIPCRLGLLKEIGLDVQAWAKSGLIDFVSFSNFWQTSWDAPLDDLRRQLGERVAVYGCVEAAPNWLFARDPVRQKQSYRLLPTSPELLRGNAAGKLALGADGIELFNFFCADQAIHNPASQGGAARYDEIGRLARLDVLRGMTKQYALASMQGYFMFPLFELAEQVPAVIEPESKRAFRLPMAAEPADKDLELVIQLVVERTATAPALGVGFNGSWPQFEAEPTDRLLFPAGGYTHHLAEHQAMNYRFGASAIRDGWNEVMVLNGSRLRDTPTARRENSVRVLSVELAVISHERVRSLPPRSRACPQAVHTPRREASVAGRRARSAASVGRFSSTLNFGISPRPWVGGPSVHGQDRQRRPSLPAHPQP